MIGRTPVIVPLVVIGLGAATLLGRAAADEQQGSLETGSDAEAAMSQAPVAAAAPSMPTAPSAPATAPSPEEAVRAVLDGTRWTIELSPLGGGEKAKPRKDTVTFGASTTASEWLSTQGYPRSNYTVTIGDDGVVVWETMQTHEGEGVAFWRGEVHGATMRGVLSRHPVEGTPQDFSWSGREADGKTIRTGEAQAQATGPRALR